MSAEDEDGIAANADKLAASYAARNLYPSVTDGGASAAPAITADSIEQITWRCQHRRRSTLRPPFRCRTDGPPAAVTRNRNLLEEIRGGHRGPSSSESAGKPGWGRMPPSLTGSRFDAPAAMAASLPARFCIASKHPVFGISDAAALR